MNQVVPASTQVPGEGPVGVLRLDDRKLSDDDGHHRLDPDDGVHGDLLQPGRHMVGLGLRRLDQDLLRDDLVSGESRSVDRTGVPSEGAKPGDVGLLRLARHRLVAIVVAVVAEHEGAGRLDLEAILPVLLGQPGEGFVHGSISCVGPPRG